VESVALGEGGISGTGTMSRPVPFNTTTWVLSIMQVSQAPGRYWRASVRKTLHTKRVKVGKVRRRAHGIAAHQRSGLYGPQLAADLGTVRRGIVLHLLTGTEVILPDRFLGLLPMP